MPKNMFTITSLDYSSCSDVLLNRKQLNSELKNAVAPLFTVRFRLGHFWSVLVNIYYLKQCFDNGMTSRRGHPQEYQTKMLVSYIGKFTSEMIFETKNDFQKGHPLEY